MSHGVRSRSLIRPKKPKRLRSVGKTSASLAWAWATRSTWGRSASTGSIPSLGDVDFRHYVDALYEGGFDGVLSVEHEDPVWGGTPEKVEQGLRIAHANLRPMVVG